MSVRPNNVRYRVDPGDVPPEKAARRLHLTLAEFQYLLPELLKRNFPPPDPTTGMFDLDAIDHWRRARSPQLFGLTKLDKLRDAREVVHDRLARI
jgi:hypothetical protein